MKARHRSPGPAGRLLVVHGHRVGHAPGGRVEISQECLARVRRAERAARVHPVEWVLFCGAGAAGGPSEARQMADLWDGPPVQLLRDELSTDTAENATEALRWARIVGATELVLVSSWWHLRLPLYYRHRRFNEFKIRHARAWRWDGVLGHLSHELRYLPEVWRAGRSHAH